MTTRVPFTHLDSDYLLVTTKDGSGESIAVFKVDQDGNVGDKCIDNNISMYATFDRHTHITVHSCDTNLFVLVLYNRDITCYKAVLKNNVFTVVTVYNNVKNAGIYHCVRENDLLHCVMPRDSILHVYTFGGGDVIHNKVIADNIPAFKTCRIFPYSMSKVVVQFKDENMKNIFTGVIDVMLVIKNTTAVKNLDIGADIVCCYQGVIVTGSEDTTNKTVDFSVYDIKYKCDQVFTCTLENTGDARLLHYRIEDRFYICEIVREEARTSISMTNRLYDISLVQYKGDCKATITENDSYPVILVSNNLLMKWTYTADNIVKKDMHCVQYIDDTVCNLPTLYSSDIQIPVANANSCTYCIDTLRAEDVRLVAEDDATTDGKKINLVDGEVIPLCVDTDKSVVLLHTTDYMMYATDLCKRVGDGGQCYISCPRLPTSNNSRFDYPYNGIYKGGSVYKMYSNNCTAVFEFEYEEDDNDDEKKKKKKKKVEISLGGTINGSDEVTWRKHYMLYVYTTTGELREFHFIIKYKDGMAVKCMYTSSTHQDTVNLYIMYQTSESEPLTLTTYTLTIQPALKLTKVKGDECAAKLKDLKLDFDYSLCCVGYGYLYILCNGVIHVFNIREYKYYSYKTCYIGPIALSVPSDTCIYYPPIPHLLHITTDNHRNSILLL